VKIDIANGSSTNWYKEGHFPGEPVFVPSPDPKAEDDGLLLSVVLDTYSNTSYLIILNASNLGQVAKAALPHSILFGYHGTFIHQN
jgi:carotenoid cleavage dioxygenase-like enzyme